MGKPDPPPGPDYNKLLEMTKVQIASNEKLFGEFMDYQQESTAKSQAVTDKVLGVMLPAMQQEADFAASQRQRYQDLGIPLENSYLDQIKQYDNQNYREERVGAAVGETANALEAARTAELQRLESYGLDPSQTRSAALDTRIQTAGAVAKAQTANNERARLDAVSLGLKGDAINLMRGLPAQTAQSYATAQGAAGTSSGAQNATNAYGQAGYQIGSGMITNSANMGVNAYNTANNIYGNQLRAYDMETSNSFGAQLGGILGAVIPAAGAAGGFGPLLGFEDGGYVDPKMSPSRGAIPDDIPARINAGEYVLDDATVRYHGLKTMSKLQKEAQEAMGKSAIPTGGQ